MKRRSFFAAVGGFVGMLFGYPATPPPVPTAEQSFGKTERRLTFWEPGKNIYVVDVEVESIGSKAIVSRVHADAGDDWAFIGHHATHDESKERLRVELWFVKKHDSTKEPL